MLVFFVLPPCISFSFVLLLTTGGSFSLPAFLLRYLLSRRGTLSCTLTRTRGVDICCLVLKGSLDGKVDEDVIGLIPVGTFNCAAFFKIGRYGI